MLWKFKLSFEILATVLATVLATFPKSWATYFNILVILLDRKGLPGTNKLLIEPIHKL
jgi:hypothetical protein